MRTTTTPSAPGRWRLIGGDDADAGRGDAALRMISGTIAVDRVDRDGKADAGVGAGRGKDGGVDADHAAGGVEQRPAGVAGIDGRIGLDDVGDLAAAGSWRDVGSAR